MCLSPIKIYNPSRKISLYGGQKYQIELPCGQCAECREARRTDIYFRSYYECLDTWRKNGYVYFDTLTYRNEDLPYVSDFVDRINRGSNFDYSCFNKEDFRLFMVRLRRQLEYHGFDVKNSLKYFVASEYGSEEYTARPHYHVLFFVTGDLDPYILSDYVDKCWQKGRTDGINYHPKDYVANHIYGPKYNNDEVHMRAVCNYVAKYVLKDSEFEDTLQKRIYAVFGYDREDVECYLNTFDGKSYMKKVMSFMKPYVRWSKGFGEYGLLYNNDEDMYNNAMRIPDANEVWRFAPLSGYLSRKKYYETAYNKSGKLYWRLTEEGKSRAFEMRVNSCEKFGDRFREWILNLDSLMKKGDKKSVYNRDLEQWIERDVTSEDIYKFRKKLLESVVKYLGDRSPEDFAMYLFFYKGRVKSIEQINREKRGIYRVDDVDVFFQRGLLSPDEIDDLPDIMVKYNYAHCTDKRHFQTSFLGDVSFDFVVRQEDFPYSLPKSVIGKKGYHKVSFEYGYDRKLDRYNGDFVDKYNKCHSDRLIHTEDWVKDNVINENSDIRFKDFDKLYDIYCSSMKYYNRRKQESYDHIEVLKKKMKKFSKKLI